MASEATKAVLTTCGCASMRGVSREQSTLEAISSTVTKLMDLYNLWDCPGSLYQYFKYRSIKNLKTS